MPSRFVSRASIIRPHATQNDEYALSRYVSLAELPALLSWSNCFLFGLRLPNVGFDHDSRIAQPHRPWARVANMGNISPMYVLTVMKTCWILISF
jgi:hypothetical protein